MFKVGQSVRINPNAAIGEKYYIGTTYSILLFDKLFTGTVTIRYIDSEGFLKVSHPDCFTFWYHPDMLTTAKPPQLKRRHHAI